MLSTKVHLSKHLPSEGGDELPKAPEIAKDLTGCHMLNFTQNQTVDDLNSFYVISAINTVKQNVRMTRKAFSGCPLYQMSAVNRQSLSISKSAIVGICVVDTMRILMIAAIITYILKIRHRNL
jgi:hypothetical protein